jgi:nucleoid-associated protein YgaU
MPVRQSDDDLADQIIEEQKRQELEKKARELEQAQKQRLEEAKQKIRERGAAAQPRTYVVQAGDTLSKIAQKLYGDASKWKEILQANKDTIPNPDLIKVGQEIKIP